MEISKNYRKKKITVHTTLIRLKCLTDDIFNNILRSASLIHRNATPALTPTIVHKSKTGKSPMFLKTL